MNNAQSATWPPDRDWIATYTMVWQREQRTVSFQSRSVRPSRTRTTPLMVCLETTSDAGAFQTLLWNQPSPQSFRPQWATSYQCRVGMGGVCPAEGSGVISTLLQLTQSRGFNILTKLDNSRSAHRHTQRRVRDKETAFQRSNDTDLACEGTVPSIDHEDERCVSGHLRVE